jgi:serine/threonine protein kinase
LADFGLSKEHVGDQDLSKTFCGSPAYLAPEMVRKKGITKSADVYGIGCVLFELLTGEAPFMDDDIDKLTRKIEAGKLSFPGYISEEAKKIIKVLL